MRLNKKLETQLNLYKEFNENQILLHELNKALKQRDQFKAERDTQIDDIAVLKANISRLERENEKLRNESIKNYKLWEESEEQERYFVKEFNKYYNLYTTLTNHIRTKAENNPGVSRYIDLVNYIDRLERADDER